MDQLERRRLLTAKANPDILSDYVISISGEFSLSHPPVLAGLEMRYIPDRDVLNTAALEEYLATLSDGVWENLEEVSTTILADLNNQLVPRWMQIYIEQNSGAESQQHRHAVLLEDRQPTWDNPSLLSRLKLR